MMDANETALEKYNARWSNGSNAQTSTLYKNATKGKTAQYGCRLQDHVLSLLGHSGFKTLKRISPAAQKWVDWMIS
jgi:hypothetical protein